MTRTMILTLQSVEFGKDDLFDLTISLSLEMEDKVSLKVKETLAPIGYL